MLISVVRNVYCSFWSQEYESKKRTTIQFFFFKERKKERECGERKNDVILFTITKKVTRVASVRPFHHRQLTHPLQPYGGGEQEHHGGDILAVWWFRWRYADTGSRRVATTQARVKLPRQITSHGVTHSQSSSYPFYPCEMSSRHFPTLVWLSVPLWGACQTWRERYLFRSLGSWRERTGGET